ncbi:zinc ribbon domain-containing protein [Streptomyces sp. NPDC002793]|uniref:NADase-type glycan-binding domain-containing protein n=1 Tax=Streptomyces sp. NPDC002793 TaxID=3154432 RepID=UPI00332050DF
MTTQNCAECGTRAEPGQSFCDACGAVLGWDSARPRSGQARTTGSSASPAAGPPAGSAPESAASDRSAGGGWDGFARDGSGDARPARPPRDSDPDPTPPAGFGGHHTGPGGAATMPGDAASAATSDASRLPQHHRDTLAGRAGDGGAGTASSYDAPRPGENDPTVPLPTPGGGSAADRARSLLVPVDEPEAAHPAPQAVAPVLPGRPDTDRPQVRVPGPQQDTGNGPPCSWCATPNRPDRHFCARCAMPLADNPERPPAPLPWWRRITGSRRNENPWAGDRPRIRRAFDRVGTWITAAVVVTLVVLGVMYLPDGIQTTRDHFAKRAPVYPTAYKASRSWTGHKPQLTFDKLSNTWWGPGVRGSGQGEWIEAAFDQPTRLLDVVITPGVSTKQDQLGKSALPHRVKATITAKDGTETTRVLTLDQGPGAQRRAFRVGEAVTVRFTIESAHGASAEKQVAIAEVEFFGRSSGDGS